MKMSQAIQGFLFILRSEGYSQATIDRYNYVLNTLTSSLDDPVVQDIQSGDLIRYFAYLRTDYIPNRKIRCNAPLSGSTLQNHWKGIRTFFRWATDELSLLQRLDEKLKLPLTPYLCHRISQEWGDIFTLQMLLGHSSLEMVQN